LKPPGREATPLVGGYTAAPSRRPEPPLNAIWGSILFIVPAIWGYNWVVMKSGLAYAGPFEFAAWRFLLGSLVLFGVMIATRRPLRIPAWGGVALVGLLQTAGNTGFTMWALLGGPAGRASVLCYTMPIWVVLLAWPFLGERPTREKWIALTASATGLGLIFLSALGKSRADAVVLGMLSGVAWAAGTVLTRRLLTREKMDVLAFSAWQMLIGGAFLQLAAFAVPGKPTEWTPYFCFALFYEVVPATAVAWLLWAALLQRVEAGLASIAILAGPIIGILSSAIQLGERPAGLEAAGMGLIIVSLVIVGPLAMRQARRAPALVSR
jgi:drug/metabolite transporter (DMT)-like permease